MATATPQQAVLISLAGPVAAGKTTLARELAPSPPTNLPEQTRAQVTHHFQQHWS